MRAFNDMLYERGALIMYYALYPNSFRSLCRKQTGMYNVLQVKILFTYISPFDSYETTLFCITINSITEIKLLSLLVISDYRI